MASKDFEGAANYLHDSIPWRLMSDYQRREWQKRANALLEGRTNFGKFNKSDLIRLSGISAAEQIPGHAFDKLEEYLSWSRADSETDRSKRERETAKRYEDTVRRVAKANPTFVVEAVQKVAPKAFEDAAVAAAPRDKIATAKAVLRNPQLSSKLYDDRETRRHITNASQRHQEKVEAEVKTENKKRSPDLVHRSGYNDVLADLFQSRRSIAKALDGVKELDLDKDETEALEEALSEITAVQDWFHSFLKSGANNFDTELQKILEG